MYLFQNEYEKALEYFRRYASVSPGDANPFDSMGELYFRMGNYDDSIKKYEEALDVKADFGSEWKLAYIYGLRGDYIEAGNWIDRAIQAATTDGLRSTAFHWKGYYLYLQGKVEAALEAFDKGSEYAEKAGLTGIMDLALRMKLWVCYEWGLYDRFENYFKQRIDFRNSNKLGSETLNQIVLLMYMGLLDIKNNRVANAKNKLNEMKQLIETLEENEKNIRQKGDGELLRAILLAEGPYDQAIEAYEHREIVPFNFTQFYTLLRPNCPYELDYPAQAYWKNSEFDKAIKEYERVISPDPGLREQLLIHPLAYYRLAKLYEEKGEREKAVEQYQKFLSLCAESDPGLTTVEDARKKLPDLK
jgi:tetratricopeptide (TPR) repeat protein